MSAPTIHLSNCVFLAHGANCDGSSGLGADGRRPCHLRSSANGALCGHCGAAMGWSISGVTFSCEGGVGVWTLADGTEWHCCVKEVTDEEIAELLIFGDTLDARLTVATA